MWQTLGFVAIVAFVIQAVTGFSLLLYYTPHPDHAFESVQHVIMNNTPYGWLFRMMHVVGSNLIVVLVFLHMLSVFFMGSYKKPRELTWMTGGLMLFVIFVFVLSGHLLPWNQLGYWATTIVTNMLTTLPSLGDGIATLLRGGDYVSGATLRRFFALHGVFLPAFFVLIGVLHVFLIKRTGMFTPLSGATGEERKPWTEYSPERHTDGYPYYPHFFLKQVFMVMVYLVVLFSIINFAPTLFLSESATIPADPFKTLVHARPAWYFLAPYQMFKLFPVKFLGAIIQLISIGIFLTWPFFDTNKEKSILKRPYLLGAATAFLALWVVLTIWGTY